MTEPHMNVEKIATIRRVALASTIIALVAILAIYINNLFITHDLTGQTIQLIINFSVPCIVCVFLCYFRDKISDYWLYASLVYLTVVTILNFVQIDYFADTQHLWAISYCAYRYLGIAMIVVNFIESYLVVLKKYLKVVDLLCILDFIIGVGGIIYFVYLGQEIYVLHYLFSHIPFSFMYLFLYPDEGYTQLFCTDTALSNSFTRLFEIILVSVPLISLISFYVLDPIFKTNFQWELYTVVITFILVVLFLYVFFFVNNVNRHILELREQAVQVELNQALIIEVHHRIRNNLQLILSLLNIHKKIEDDEKSLVLLNDIYDRVLAMSLVYGEFYEDYDFRKLYIDSYINDLSDSIIKKYKTDVEWDIDVPHRVFDLDNLVPLSLIIGESISNSVQHAFEGRDDGKITIKLTELGEDEFELIVADNGIGCSQEVIDSPKNMGHLTVHLLASQLDGDLSYDLTNGVKTILKFKLITTSDLGY